MPSPFQQVAEQLRTNGYSVLPLRGRSKVPLVMEWAKKYCASLADDAIFQQWMTWHDANIGLCLGSASNLVAFDFDANIENLHEEILNIIGDSPVKKAGEKGFTAFYRFGNERSAQYKKDGAVVLDILANGRQTVLPPSIHPNGNAYRWLTEKTLLNTRADELPTVSPENVALVQKLFRTEKPVTVTNYPKPFNFDEKDDLAKALTYLCADDYQTWITVGMGIKDKFGDGGYSVWDHWSATSSKYGGARESWRKWNSFNGEGTHIETVYWMAMEAGYVPPKQEFAPVENVIEEGGNLSEVVVPHGIMPTIIKKPSAPPPPDVKDILNSPPNLVGLIAEHINATAMFPQPLLALGASLAMAGTIMANRVKGPSGLFTNIYTLGIAESSAGKDHARRVCRAIMGELNITGLEIGLPKSGAGLLSGLRKAEATGIILIDEFGRYLNTLSQKNAASHEREICTILMELYTSAGGYYAGMEYADHDGKMSRKPIVSPCLSLYPVTTPARFYDSLTGREAVDGFMARFMIFESKEFAIEPRADIRDVNDIPSLLRDTIEWWKVQKKNVDKESNMGETLVSPFQVKYTERAAQMFRDFTVETRTIAAAESEKKSNLSAIWGRLSENAQKIALIAHSGEQINEEVADWAIKVARYCCYYIVDVINEHIGDNENERNTKKVVGIIRELQSKNVLGAPMSQVILKTRFLNRKERHDILEDLRNSGQIEREIVSSVGQVGPAPTYLKVI